MKRGILSICLTLALCLGLLTATALAAGDTYLALGDSITTGYGPGGNVASPFADQVAAAQGYTLNNQAADGETTGSLKTKLEQNQIDVSDAKLITITIGGNDLMDALYGYLVERYNEGKDENQKITVDQLKEALANPSLSNLAMLQAVFGYLGDFSTSSAASAAFDSVQSNLTEILKTIRQGNAAAKILVATQYDPYQWMSVSDTDMLKNQITALKTTFTAGVTALNVRIQAAVTAANDGNISVVDVYTAFAGSQDNLCNAYYNGIQGVTVDMDPDFHPNQDGHDLIAETINSKLPKPSYDLWISGTQITNRNYTDVLEDGTVAYDPFTNTLTLDGAKIQAASTYGIQSNLDELTIQLMGENSVAAASNYYGIYAQSGSLTLTGDGALTIDAPSGPGIFAVEDLTITGAAKVTVDAYDTAICSSNGDIRISGNAVVSSISTRADEYAGNGLYTQGNVEISDAAQVTAESYYPAIYADYDVSITGGTVSVVSTSDCAIWTSGDLEIAGANTVVNTFIEENDGTIRYSCGGIAALYDLSIDGATVNAYAECAEETDRFCIRCDQGNFSVSAGTVNAVIANEPESGLGNPAIYCGNMINFTGGQINASSRLHCAIEVYAYYADDDAVSYITGDAEVTLISYYRDALNCATDLVISGNAIVEASSGTSSGISGNNRNITIEGNAQVKTFSEGDPALYVGRDLKITGPAQVYAESESKTDSAIKVWKTLAVQDGANVTALGGIAVNNSQKLTGTILDIQDSIITVSSDEEEKDFDNINKNGLGTFSIQGSWVHMSREDEELPITDSVVFYGASGTVIGNAAVPGNVALTSGETLTIPTDTVLTVPDGVTLTNNGALAVEGILEVRSTAALTGAANVSGKVYVFETDGGVNPVDGVTFTLSETGEVYAQLTALDGTTIQPASRTLGSYSYTPVNGSEETFTNRWSYYVSSGGGISSYSITTEEADNGTVILSPSQAYKGTTVTVTATPDEGYELAGLTVTDASGNTVAATKVSDTQYTFKMPASKVTVKATFEKEKLVSTLPFTDVAVSDWFYEAVTYVYDKGIMNGTTATKFSPHTELTRGMIVTILYRLEGEPNIGGSTFTDVSPSQYYADPIAWAAANGIVTGYGNGSYGPGDSITREQLAAILYRYAQYKGYDVSVGEDTNILSYTDAFDVSEYAIPAMQWACGAGILEGSAGALHPQGNATRAQVATMLMRFCGYYADPE